jgi:hypothetical protein
VQPSSILLSLTDLTLSVGEISHYYHLATQEGSGVFLLNVVHVSEWPLNTTALPAQLSAAKTAILVAETSVVEPSRSVARRGVMVILNCMLKVGI